MQEVLHRVAKEEGFEFAIPVLERYARPAVGFRLLPDPSPEVGSSRLGGGADVPEGFEWPEHKGRPLDFLLQLNLADLAPFGEPWYLPKEGLLTFFYDLDEQPWGYDPSELTGSRIAYFAPESRLARRAPTSDAALDSARLAFFPMLTLPHVGSLHGEPMWKEISETYGWEEAEEEEASFELAAKLALAYHPQGRETQHRFGGYPWEVQNPMETEAQLVTHGFFCGDASPYADPRAAHLLDDVSEWRLVLQLDSDEDAGLMWGDLGMLYFWSRLTDLAARAFDRSWMTLQCG